MLISLAPLYHNKNYDKNIVNGEKKNNWSQKKNWSQKNNLNVTSDGGKESRVAHLLYACLNVSAVSRDLAAIDKV